MKKKSGSDSTKVASAKTEFIGGKKANDYSTSYNKTNNFKKQPVPDYPYGQQYKSPAAAKVAKEAAARKAAGLGANKLK